MDDLIKIESLLGNSKVVVGDHLNDLVLETLGKVYIKSGRNFRLLNDLFTLLDKTTETVTQQDSNKIIIVENSLEQTKLEYPGDGHFIFNKGNSTLYLSFNNSYFPLVEVKNTVGSYVKTSGDTMTGTLEILTSGTPLKINSTNLIKNLNSEYLGGYTDQSFAKKYINENIQGNWTFSGKNVAKNDWRFDSDIISNGNLAISGNVSSKEFASGFSGYGWMLDSSTNTLTIDNLVVRKAMQVYEMVINKIRATNGSLWVTNASTCVEAENITLVRNSISNGEVSLSYLNEDGETTTITLETEEDGVRLRGFSTNKYYLILSSEVINEPGSFSGVNFAPENRVTTEYYNYLIKFKSINSFISEYINFGLNISELLSNLISEEFYENYSFSNLEVTKINYSDFINSKFKIETNKSGKGTTVDISLYNKYFGLTKGNDSNYWIISIDEMYPIFEPGDILRCQKIYQGNTKYYDALFIQTLSDDSFLVQLAGSVFDKYSEVHITNEGINIEEKYNKKLYSLTNKSNGEFSGDYGSFFIQAENDLDVMSESDSSIKSENDYNGESSLTGPSVKDDLVQIGNICNPRRQNAIYLTSTDDKGPFIDIISGLNRPDYSVIYKEVVVDGGETKIVPTTTTKVRLGNLDGIYNPMFKKQPHGFGLYGSNVFLTGDFYLNNGKAVMDISEEGIYQRFKDNGLIINDEGITLISDQVKFQTSSGGAKEYLDDVINGVVGGTVNDAVNEALKDIDFNADIEYLKGSLLDITKKEESGLNTEISGGLVLTNVVTLTGLDSDNNKYISAILNGNRTTLKPYQKLGEFAFVAGINTNKNKALINLQHDGVGSNIGNLFIDNKYTYFTDDKGNYCTFGTEPKSKISELEEVIHLKNEEVANGLSNTTETGGNIYVIDQSVNEISSITTDPAHQTDYTIYMYFPGTINQATPNDNLWWVMYLSHKDYHPSYSNTIKNFYDQSIIEKTKTYKITFPQKGGSVPENCCIKGDDFKNHTTEIQIDFSINFPDFKDDPNYYVFYDIEVTDNQGNELLTLSVNTINDTKVQKTNTYTLSKLRTIKQIYEEDLEIELYIKYKYLIISKIKKSDSMHTAPYSAMKNFVTPILNITPRIQELTLLYFAKELIISPEYITFKSTTENGEVVSLQIPSELKSASNSKKGDLYVDDNGFVKLKQ